MCPVTVRVFEYQTRFKHRYITQIEVSVLLRWEWFFSSSILHMAQKWEWFSLVPSYICLKSQMCMHLKYEVTWCKVEWEEQYWSCNYMCPKWSFPNYYHSAVLMTRPSSSSIPIFMKLPDTYVITMQQSGLQDAVFR